MNAGSGIGTERKEKAIISLCNTPYHGLMKAEKAVNTMENKLFYAPNYICYGKLMLSSIYDILLIIQCSKIEYALKHTI